VKNEDAAPTPSFALAGTDPSLFRGDEFYRTDPHRNVEAFGALKAHGLKGNGLVQTADQNIGAAANTDARSRTYAAVLTLQRFCLEIGRRRKDRPRQLGILGVTQVCADTGDVADIMFGRLGASAHIAARQFVLGPDNIQAARNIAGEDADLYASGRSKSRRPRKHQQTCRREGTNNGLEHTFSFQSSNAHIWASRPPALHFVFYPNEVR
jgi:hypothetical protein